MPYFLCNRKLRSYYTKTLRGDAHCGVQCQMSQATAAGARMCQGTFFVLVNCRITEKIYCIITNDVIILTRLDITNISCTRNTA